MSPTNRLFLFGFVDFFLRRGGGGDRASETLGGPLKYALMLVVLTALEWRSSVVGVVAILQVCHLGNLQLPQYSGVPVSRQPRDKPINLVLTLLWPYPSLRPFWP